MPPSQVPPCLGATPSFIPCTLPFLHSVLNQLSLKVHTVQFSSRLCLLFLLSCCKSLRNAICPVNQPLYQTQPFYAVSNCEHFQSTARIVNQPLYQTRPFYAAAQLPLKNIVNCRNCEAVKARQGIEIGWIWLFS